jgi:glycosyltransferase involved in cell wall biosynthesis
MTMRPEITLALLGYNRAAFIDAAIDSAFAQIGEPIEILLSDDVSTDGTYERMLERASAYRGPHEVVVRRNTENIGVTRHLAAVVQSAQGDLTVIMDSDDVSLPTRAAESAQAWRDSGRKLDLIASHVIDMREDGQDVGLKRVDALERWPDVAAWARRRPHVIGAAHAVTRRLYERFGPLRGRLLQPDQVNVLRAICAGGAMTIDRPLLRYRRGGMSSAERSPSEWRAHLAHRTRRHLAVIEQWLEDASVAGCRDTVEQGVHWNRRREEFMRDLLDADLLVDQMRIVMGRHDVPAGWRWLRLADVRAPRASLAARRVRNALATPYRPVQESDPVGLSPASTTDSSPASPRT